MKSRSQIRREAIQDPGLIAQENIELRDKLSVATEALEYYAHPDHYVQTIRFTGIRQPGVLTEGGQKARAALERIGEEK